MNFITIKFSWRIFEKKSLETVQKSLETFEKVQSFKIHCKKFEWRFSKKSLEYRKKLEVSKYFEIWKPDRIFEKKNQKFKFFSKFWEKFKSLNFWIFFEISNSFQIFELFSKKQTYFEFSNFFQKIFTQIFYSEYLKYEKMKTFWKIFL